MDQMSVKDALKMVVDRLGKLRPPIELYNDLTVPIMDSRELLKECVIAIERAEAEAKAKEQGEADA